MAIINRRSSRKSLALALAIVGVAGLSMASAAQLTVGSTDVVAGVDDISSCDDGVTVTYSPSYDSSIPGYTVNSVTISGLDGTCTGTILVNVTDVNDVSLASGSIAYAAGSVTIPFAPVTAVDVADIFGVAVAIG